MSKLLAGTILIGSAGRNSGKTTLAVNIIRAVKKTAKSVPVYAVKVITIAGERGVCQRGGIGCGICTSISENYQLEIEQDSVGQKDTSKLLSAGADKVFLLKVIKEHLEEAMDHLQEQIPSNALLICESNSVREYYQPDLFLFMYNTKQAIKPSAKSVYKLADSTFYQIEDSTNLTFWLNYIDREQLKITLQPNNQTTEDRLYVTLNN